MGDWGKGAGLVGVSANMCKFKKPAQSFSDSYVYSIICFCTEGGVKGGD